MFHKDHTLSAKKGELVQLIKDSGKGWSSCTNFEGKIGYLPTKYLRKSEATAPAPAPGSSNSNTSQDGTSSHRTNSENGPDFSLEVIEDYTAPEVSFLLFFIVSF